jgi:hypothetical protein
LLLTLATCSVAMTLSIIALSIMGLFVTLSKIDP